VRSVIIILAFLLSLTALGQAPKMGRYDNDSLPFPYSIEILDPDSNTVYRKRFDQYGNLLLLENDIRSYSAEYHDSVTYRSIKHSLKLKKDSFYQEFYSIGKMKSQYYQKGSHQGYEQYFPNGLKQSEYSDIYPRCFYRYFDDRGVELYRSEQSPTEKVVMIRNLEDRKKELWKYRFDAKGDSISFSYELNGELRKAWDRLRRSRRWCVDDTCYTVSPTDSIVERGRFCEDRYLRNGMHLHRSSVWEDHSKIDISYKEQTDGTIYQYQFSFSNFIQGTMAKRYEWIKDLSSPETYIERRYHDFSKSTAPLQYEVRRDKDSNLIYTYSSTYYDLFSPKKEVVWTAEDGYKVTRHKKPKKHFFKNRKRVYQPPYMPRHDRFQKLEPEQLYKVDRFRKGTDTMNYKLVAVKLQNGPRKYSEDDFIKSLFKATIQGVDYNFEDLVDHVLGIIDFKQKKEKAAFPVKIELYIDDKFTQQGRIRLTGDGEDSAQLYLFELQKWLHDLSWTYGEGATVRYFHKNSEVISMPLEVEKPEIYFLFFHQDRQPAPTISVHGK
jgi:hypothetical protein